VNVLLLLLVAALLGPALQHVYSDIPDFALLCVLTAAGLVFAADVQIAGALYRVRERVVPFALVANYNRPSARPVQLGSGAGTKTDRLDCAYGARPGSTCRS